MISRQYRFHGHGSLQYVHTHGQTQRGSGIALRYVANSRRETYRCAVIVSRKVSKSAVVRNRIRRRIYESVRILSSRFDGVYDIAFLVYEDRFADLPVETLVNEIEKLARKAGLIE
jgi:ribonuclease P protein component